jgi:3-deoxy-D-manno-octulosonic acid kinase
MSWTRYLHDPLLADFIEVVVDGATRALVRAGYESEPELFGSRGSARTVTLVSGGRAAHPVVELSGGERAVLRAYRRGGLVRHVNRKRYFLGHRALEELRATECARRSGVNAPVVLAAVESRRGFGYTAALATRWIEDARDLLDWLRTRSDAETGVALREAGRQIGLMHDAGIAHPDLTLRNVLVQEGSEVPRIFLLDFDRARILTGTVPSDRRERDLRRFERSARKLGIPFGSAEWREIRLGYGSGGAAEGSPE